MPPGFVAVVLLLLLLLSPFICISILLAFQIFLLNALIVTEIRLQVTETSSSNEAKEEMGCMVIAIP